MQSEITGTVREPGSLLAAQVQVPSQTPFPPKLFSGTNEAKTVLTAKKGIARRRIQNQSSVVVFVSIGTTPASADQYHYTLPATTAGADGTSGILDLSDVYGDVSVFSSGAWTVSTLEVPTP